jgi:hypothetical protein
MGFRERDPDVGERREDIKFAKDALSIHAICLSLTRPSKGAMMQTLGEYD